VKETEITPSNADASPPDIGFEYDISFADSETSPATRVKIEEHLARLQRHYDRITFCKVFVRIPHKHGGLRFYHIHIELDVPGKRIAVSREPEANDSHSDIQIAIKDAFAKLTRQLEDFIKTRNERKEH
jgi:putative sigma-54 modulation protein